MAASAAKIQAMNAVIDNECPICQCVMCLPTSIPSCGHKFCFLCLKGVSLARMGGCPICRGPIDANIFKHPSLHLDLKMDVPMSPQQPSSSNATLRPVKEEVDEDVKPDVNALNASMAQNADTAKVYWLYEGRHAGWWRFDPRIEKDLEEAYSNHMPLIEVTICGNPYIIDYTTMKQYPKNDKDTSRDIKRVNANEFDTLNVKGLAGVLSK